MSREDVIAVAVRLFAIFLFITLLRFFAGMMTLHQVSPLLVWVVPVVGVAICALLWFFPLSIARKLLPVMREPRSEAGMDGSMALSVGLTLLGVWLLATALPNATYWLSLFVLSRQSSGYHLDWGPEQMASIATTIAELVLAVWLVFGSAGIRRLILRFRYGRFEGGV